MPNEAMKYGLKVAREMIDAHARGRLECDEFTGPYTGRNRRCDVVAACRALISLASAKHPDEERLDWLEGANSPFDRSMPLQWVIEQIRIHGAVNVRAAIDAARSEAVRLP